MAKRPQAAEEKMNLTRLVVAHCVVDAQLQIVGTNELFEMWVGESQGALVNALPILVGYESILEGILRGEDASLHLPYLQIFADREQYFDLSVERFVGKDDALLLLLVDSTQTAEKDQASRQEHNELRLEMVNQERQKTQLEAQQQTLEAEVMKRTAALRNELRQHQYTTQQLQVTQRLLIEAQQLVDVGHFEWQLIENEMHWSEMMFQIYGVDSADFTPTPDALWRFAHVGQQQEARQAVQTAAENGESFQVEGQIVRPNQTVRSVVLRGRVIHNEADEPFKIIGVCRDITRRQYQERALEDSMRRLEILHNVDQAIFSRQSPSRLIDLALAELGQMLPYDIALVSELNAETFTSRVFATMGDAERLQQITTFSPSVEIDVEEVTLLANLRHYEVLPPPYDWWLGHQMCSVMTVPAHIEDEFYLTCSFAAVAPDVFRPSHVDIALEVMTQVAVALRSRRAAVQAEQRLQEMTMLAQTSAAVAQTLDVQEMLQIAAKQLARSVGADSCFILTWEDEPHTLSPLVTYGSSTNNLSRTRETKLNLLEYQQTYEALLARQPLLLRAEMGPTAPEAVWLREHGYSTLLILPLIVSDELVGAAVIMSVADRLYSETEIALCVTLSNQTAAYLVNARLFEQLQQQADELEQRVSDRTAELSASNQQLAWEIEERQQAEQALRQALVRTEALYRSSRPLVRVDQLETLLETVVDSVAEALPASRVSLFTVDIAYKKVLHMVRGGRDAYLIGDVDFHELWQGLSGWVMRHKEAVLSLADRPDERESVAVQQKRRSLEVGSIVVAPLLYGDRILGTITAINHVAEPNFTEQDVELMNALANQAVIAIENGRLYAEARQWADKLRALHEIGTEIVSSLHLKDILQVIVDDAAKLFGATNSLLVLFNGQNGYTAELVGHGYAAQELERLSHEELMMGVTGWVYHEKVATLSPNIQTDSRNKGRALATALQEGPWSAVVAPLLIEDEVIGTLTVLSKNYDRPLREADVSLVEMLASQAAIAIENGRLFEAAQEADRLKSAFLATMSHELRTPLNSIIGFVGIILQGLAGPLNTEQEKQLKMVRLSANHLLALISDVLDISKIEAGQIELTYEPVEVSEVIDEVMRLIRPLAENKGLALTSVIDPAVGTLISDRRRVHQILLNLGNNAIKFTNEGGVQIEAKTAGNMVAITVIDSGIGIKEEDFDTLFEPFRQIDIGLQRRHEGTGLGLSICQRLAQLLGGSIKVTSTFGEGSQFTLLLP